MYHRTKKHVHLLLHPTEGDTKWDKVINSFIMILILLNVIAVIVETEPGIYDKHEKFFNYFDLISVILFSIEYVLRVWSCVHEEKYSHWIRGRIRYMLTWGALIDLMAILPFYLHAVFIFDLRVLRILRLFRFLRIFRLTSYMKSAKLVTHVFKSKFYDLMLSLILASCLIVISACIMYFTEHQAQPDKFKSIPDTLWWSLVTLTTVGYGDMVPVTALGKILTGVIALGGVALFALPAGIITSGFLEEMRRVKRPKILKCPHCGQPIELHEEHGSHLEHP